MPLKICYDNQADLATVSTDDSVLNLPPSNVQDQRLSRIYRGDESINFDIIGDGALKTISQAYTNLADPDLTNWITSNCTVVDSGDTLNGEIIYKLTTTSAVQIAFIKDVITFPSNGQYVVAVTIRKPTDLTMQPGYGIYDVTAAAFRALMVVNFVTQVITETNGDLLKAVWHDDDSVTLYLYTESITSANNNEMRLYIDRDGSYTIGDYDYFTMPFVSNLVDDKTMFPFVDGSHSADIIDATLIMQDEFTLDIELDPWFAYNDATVIRFVVFYNDVTHQFRVYFTGGFIKVFWQDGGTARLLTSQQFDDGTSLTNINQLIRITISAKLNSGINDSRLIVTPLESGSQFEDTSWDGTPDTKKSTFPDVSYGNDGTGSIFADTGFVYIRYYGGLLVGAVTDSDDITELLADKTLLSDVTYQTKLIATDLLIGNSTIRDGDTIILVGNDLDSFGEGSPVYESVTWAKDIIHHSFTKANLQYWRLIIESNNVIDIGRIFLGSSLTTPGIAYLIPQDINSATKKTIVVSGQSYGDERYFADQVSARWPDLTEDKKDEIVNIFKTMDIATPFFITYDKAGQTLGTMYVTFDMRSLKVTPLGKRNLYTITAKFREEPR